MFPASVFHESGAQGPAGPAGATGAAGATGPAGPQNLLVSMLTANATNATGTMAATGLTVPLVSGTRYRVEANLMIDAGAGVDGSLFDADASTIAVSNIRLWWEEPSGTTPSYTTSLADNFIGPTAGQVAVRMAGSVEPSSSGNFALRFAQVSHLTETLILFRGSSLIAMAA